MGRGEFRAARILFSLTFPLQEYCFPYARTFFLGYSPCMNFFLLIFPYMISFVLHPPPPHNFSNGLSLEPLGTLEFVPGDTSISRQLFRGAHAYVACLKEGASRLTSQTTRVASRASANRMTAYHVVFHTSVRLVWRKRQTCFAEWKMKQRLTKV